MAFRHHDVGAGFEQSYLLCSDVHLDAPECNRQLFFRHLEQAKDRDAPVLVFGDLLDGVHGRDDPRRSKDGTQEKYNKDEYVDALVDETESDLDRWRDNIAMLSLGNHGDAIVTHYGSNPIRRLCKRFGAEYFGYAGFIRFRFSGRTGNRRSRLLYFHHGAGGGGPVTRGVINTNRRQVYQPEPDIIVAGHIHDAWLMPIARVRMSASDVPYQDLCWHVQLPSYKDEWGGGRAFHMRKEGVPKPVGAWWLTFVYDAYQRDNIRIDLVLAQ
jgi:hypothetical protein